MSQLGVNWQQALSLTGMSPTITATTADESGTNDNVDSSKRSETTDDIDAKPRLSNSLGYFSRKFNPKPPPDLFYHRLVQKSVRDNFRNGYVHETFLHQALCREWVQHYRRSLPSRSLHACFPLSASLELALGAWLKTSLQRSGSLDKNREPCKSYTYILLRSIWSPFALMPVKFQRKPPYAPRLWSIVENVDEDELIEIYGLNANGDKDLLVTCEGCHFAANSHDESLTASNMTTRGAFNGTETSSENEIDPLPLSEPSRLFNSLRQLFVEKRKIISSNAVEDVKLKLYAENFPDNIPLTSERIHYGDPFRIISSRFYSSGTFGQHDFVLMAELSLEKISGMLEQYIIPPPLLEGMLHHALNTFIINSVSDTDKTLMLPRAVSIEGLYVDYKNISKVLKSSSECWVLITTTSSQNIHDYDVIDDTSETQDESSVEKESKSDMKAINLDCSLISADEEVFVHAANVLYCYQIEGNDVFAGDDIQAQHIRNMKSSSALRSSSISSRSRKKQKSGASDKKLTPATILQKVRSIAHMFVENGDVLSDEASLMDYGWDSLATAEFIAKLSTNFQLNLPPTLVFNYPNVNDIHTHLCGLLLSAEDNGDVISLSTSSGNDEEYVKIDDVEVEVDVNGEMSSSDEKMRNNELSDAVPNDILDRPAVDNGAFEENLNDVDHIRSRTWFEGHCNGNTVNGNPWFSVFYAPKEVDLR